MNNDTITAADIAAMTDEEVAAFNKKLNKILVRKIGISIALSVAGLVAVSYIDRKIANDEEN